MPHWLARQAFGALLGALRSHGYRVLGPVIRDGVLAWGEVDDPRDLAAGWRDRQEPGGYRLEPASGPRWFTVVNGPGSLKPLLFAAREPLLQITWGDPDGALQVTPQLPESERIAVLGARACDLAAVAVQDRVFLGDRADPHYAARRGGLLLIGMSCTRCAPTCFCTSVGTGPAVASGHDLALTELDDGFLVRAGSAAGEEILSDLPLVPADGAALEAERGELQDCAASMQRGLQPTDPRALLYANLEHARWDEVGARCLSCGNCTQVCPTCFCHDERDEPALNGPRSLRVREWDSCFNRDHGQIHGHCFRPSIRDRYRQWLVHKLASWIDQFGTSGCVGCGRCISWCPVGIDLTEELAAIQATPGAPGPAAGDGIGAGGA